MAIDQLDLSSCNSCGICFSICPQDVFRVDEKSGKPIIKYSDDCVACWSCEFFCPANCIKVSEPRPRELPGPY